MYNQLLIIKERYIFRKYLTHFATKQSIKKDLLIGDLQERNVKSIIDGFRSLKYIVMVIKRLVYEQLITMNYYWYVKFNQVILERLKDVERKVILNCCQSIYLILKKKTGW